MRKLTWLLGAMLLLLSLTGCGNKVDSESIRSYLESSYYNESDASVDEIKDTVSYTHLTLPTMSCV